MRASACSAGPRLHAPPPAAHARSKPCANYAIGRRFDEPRVRACRGVSLARARLMTRGLSRTTRCVFVSLVVAAACSTSRPQSSKSQDLTGNCGYGGCGSDGSDRDGGPGSDGGGPGDGPTEGGPGDDGGTDGGAPNDGGTDDGGNGSGSGSGSGD